MRQMRGKTRQSRSGAKAGEQKLIDNDNGDTSQSDLEIVMMKKGDSEQDERKQHKINRDAGYGWIIR